MINTKINIYDIFIKFMVLFPLTTLISGSPVIGSYFNKILICLFFLVLFLTFRKFKYKKFDMFVMMVTILLHIIAMLFTGTFKYNNFNQFFYLLIWVILYIIFSTKYDLFNKYIDNNISFIRKVVYIWIFLVGVSFFFPSSYSYPNHSFISFAGDTFRLSPSALLIISMIMILNGRTNRFHSLFLLIVPFLSILMGGSRTYLCIAFMFIFMYLYIISKRKYKVYILSFLVLLLFLFTMPYTGIGRKILSTINSTNTYFDFWGNITSGRTVFWKYDIEAFLSLSTPKKFVGNGFNYVYEINEKYIHNAIYAHNDFINILLNFGYAGLFVYLYAFKKLCNFSLNNKTIPFLVKLLYFVSIFINSFFNMSYTYLCATLSYIFFGYFIKIYYERSLNDE